MADMEGLLFKANINSSKSPSSENSVSKTRLEEAQKLYQAKKHALFHISEDIMDRKIDKRNIVAETYRYLPSPSPNQYLGWIQMEMQSLQDVLHDIYGLKLPNHGIANRPRSPAQEIDDHIASSSNRIQHGFNTIAKEKQLLRDLKQAEADKQKLTADAATAAVKTPYNLGSIENIQERIKMSTKIGELKSEEVTRRANRKRLDKELKAVEIDIRRLEMKLAIMNREKDAAYKWILELEKQRD